MSETIRLIDIGANLCDPMYKGIYNEKKKHEGDLDAVLGRAIAAGVERIMLTSGDLETLKEAINIIKHYDSKEETRNLIKTTCGVHPTMGLQFETGSTSPEEHLEVIAKIGLESIDNIVAIGEFGLDYDRLNYCDQERQLKYFKLQFDLCERLKKPLFLHMRACADDFVKIIQENRHRFSTGVVHSFTGNLEEAMKMIDLGLYIGINGCSLKTQESLDTIAAIPDEWIMIETDGPWCEIRPSHAGFGYVKTSWPSCKKENFVHGRMVRGRAEPCQVLSVLEVISSIKGVSAHQLGQTIYSNTMKVFFPST